MTFIEPAPFTDDDPPVRREPPPPEVSIEHLTIGQKEARFQELRALDYDRLTPVEKVELEKLGVDDFADVGTFEDWCRKPPPDLVERLSCLNVVGTNTVAYAIYKCGKSVLMANLLRTYADGDPFLDQFDLITPVDGSIAVWEYEDTDSMMFDRIATQQIRNLDKLAPRPMRGRARYPMDDDDAAILISHAKAHGVEVVVLNTMSTALQGDPNKPKMASEFLTRLEDIKAEAGFREYVMVAHTGHPGTRGEFGIPVNEHIFGSSRFMGWYDALWRYSIGASEARYLSITGRQRCVPPQLRVVLDPDTMRLTAKPTAKADRAVRQTQQSKRTRAQVKTGVEKLLQKKKHRDGVSKNTIEHAVEGDNNVIRAVLAELVEDGQIKVDIQGRSHLHYWAES